MKKGKLYGVGVGPGDPELITLKAIRTIKESSIIAVPKSGDNEKVALNIAKSAIGELNKEIIELNMPMTRDKDILNDSHNKAAEVIIDYINEGKNVSFLTLGDPSIYSTYIYVHKRVIEKGYEAEIISGVPSFCAVASKLNEGLVEGKEPLHIIPASYSGIDEGLSFSGTKVLMKTGKSLAKVKDLLNEKGLINKSKMVVKCGMDGEEVYKDLNSIDENASYFSIIVVKDGENI